MHLSRRFPGSLALGLALLTAAATAAAPSGCGGHGHFAYPTAESPLRLDRVVLYRNGIGYFERVGHVDGDVLTIKVRKDQVNDLLKSLTVVERDSGRAVSVSMPLDPQTWANAALATLRPGQGSLADVLDALRGTEVVLDTDDGSMSGRLAMVETLTAPPDPDRSHGGAPFIDHRVTLLDGNDMRVVKLSRVHGVRLQDGDLAMQFNRTLDASAGEGMFQQVAVSIRLAGADEHDLLVSYVVAAPMWKPTYRVVLPKGDSGKALLQGWAVVDNTSGEEWHQVQMALTAGAPIAFRYDLHTPRDVARADLTESGVQRRAAVMMGETTYDNMPEPATEATPMPAPAPPPAEVEDEKNAPRRSSRAPGGRGYGASATGKADGMAGRYGGGGGAGAIDQTAELPRPTIDIDALRRSTQAQARASTVAGQTRFELDQRVTVPQGTSTMVAIVNAEVEGEDAFLFRPGGAGSGYETNPYRVVRFKNSTPFALEPGPISIYAGGSFVGEGLSETVGAGTSATIPFAVETGIMVTSSTKDASDQMHLIKMSRGVLEVEQFARRATIYTARAQTMKDGFTVLIRHPKSGWNYKLIDRPKGAEDLPDGYLVPLVIKRGQKTGSLTVVEQTPSRSSMSIWDGPALGLLESLLVSSDLTPELKRKLRPVVDKRRELARIDEQIQGLTERRNKLDQRANELRQNIRAISKNNRAAPQRQKWTKQLDEFTSEANKIGADLAGLEAKRMDKRIELEDTIQNLEITAPPGKRTGQSGKRVPPRPGAAH